MAWNKFSELLKNQIEDDLMKFAKHEYIDLPRPQQPFRLQMPAIWCQSILYQYGCDDWYEKVSDVTESWVWFAYKNLTPCRMQENDFLIGQIIAKCHSFPIMYDML